MDYFQCICQWGNNFDTVSNETKSNHVHFIHTRHDIETINNSSNSICVIVYNKGNKIFDYALGQMKAKDTFAILLTNLSHNYFFFRWLLIGLLLRLAVNNENKWIYIYINDAMTISFYLFLLFFFSLCITKFGVVFVSPSFSVRFWCLVVFYWCVTQMILSSFSYRLS